MGDEFFGMGFIFFHKDSFTWPDHFLVGFQILVF